MIKKAILLIAAVALSCVSQLRAQYMEGRWTVYPVVSESFEKAVDTPKRLYALSGNTLMHYGYDDNEHYIYNVANGLSETGAITGMYYNYDRGFLAVVYESSNIDLIYDDGRIVNLPEVRDAVLNTARKINSVRFDGDRMYLATAFGFVVYDTKRHEVAESGRLGFSADYVLHFDGIMLVTSRPKAYFAADGTRRSSIDCFTEGTAIWAEYQIYRLGENSIVFRTNQKAFFKRTYNFAARNYASANVAFNIVDELMPTAEGVMGYSATTLTFAGHDGSEKSFAIPETYKDCAVLAASSPKSVWFVKDGALCRVDLSGDTPKTLMTLNAPEGSTVADASIMKWNADGSRLYIANRSCTFVLDESGDNYTKASYIDVFENGAFTDVAVKHASRYNNTVPDMWNNPETDRLGGVTAFAVDPDDDSIIYQSSNDHGIAMIKDGDIAAISNKSNNPTPSDKWLNRTMGVDIDAEGNLWMFPGYTNGSDPAIGILPAAKRRKLGEVTKTDWISIPAQKILTGDETWNRDFKSLFCSKSNIKFFVVGHDSGGLIVYNDGGQPLKPSVHTSTHYFNSLDTENNTNGLTFVNDLAEDHNGAVWMATDRGVCYVPEPAKAVGQSALPVKRPIVARNDGTNYGDYLLDAEFTHCIAVDPSNRKWIGTKLNGVYLVSADGTKILAHYNTANSPLPSDCVYSISCDPTSNRVYFGTNRGVAEFDSDSAPGAPSYSDVYAYPNPVRPEYTGWITITGLMDNSYVKIADIAGNVFFSGLSEGGMVSWDGCDASGRRVKTGVYLVFASQADGGSSGTVAKIMVIN